MIKIYKIYARDKDEIDVQKKLENKKLFSFSNQLDTDPIVSQGGDGTLISSRIDVLFSKNNTHPIIPIRNSRRCDKHNDLSYLKIPTKIKNIPLLNAKIYQIIKLT